MQAVTTSFARFLDVANAAWKVASPAQRSALRTLSLMKLTLDERAAEISKIMGWEA